MVEIFALASIRFGADEPETREPPRSTRTASSETVAAAGNESVAHSGVCWSRLSISYLFGSANIRLAAVTCSFGSSLSAPERVPINAPLADVNASFTTHFWPSTPPIRLSGAISPPFKAALNTSTAIASSGFCSRTIAEFAIGFFSPVCRVDKVSRISRFKALLSLKVALTADAAIAASAAASGIECLSLSSSSSSAPASSSSSSSMVID